ncbi:MAG: hypothetical protein KKA55_01815 [Proteobacteria bacterium]|nr:hypothetical protein [Pseudomonadota bacterium]MBU1594255.1 hypothetical protein [Pseudomonadota bacterium]
MGTLIPIGNYGLDIEGELPQRINDVLLIVGGAPGGIDAAVAFAKDTKCDVAAVNGTIANYPGSLFLAVSLHEDLLPSWVKARKNKKARPCVIANDPLPEGVEGGLDVVIRLNRACPSSGIYAALIGRAMGYQRIVLAGVELAREGERTAYERIVQAAVKKGALAGVESLSGGWLAQALKAKH